MTLAAELALGRILRMGARPTQDGDDVMYEKCRAIILDELLGPGVSPSEGYTSAWARDRLRGAQGDS